MFYASQNISFIFGLGAGIAWFISALYSFFALRIKLDLSAPNNYNQDDIGIKMGTDENGEPAFTINGITPPTQRALTDYQKSVSLRNMLSSVFNGIGAILACSAAYTTYIS